MSGEIKNTGVSCFGDFVLFDEIGRGGMGVVYDAHQTTLNRPVALKLLHANLATNATSLQRLRLEAEAAARLDHPNIVPIYETGVHDGHPYLAMQLIEGESLAERIKRLGAGFKEQDAAMLMTKITRAVAHAHQRGVLHRDLKPANILIDGNDEPHLIDFGLAKCVEQDSGMTITGTFMGTPAYASPEQASGKNKSVTTASDIYSLGAVLYAMLTGQPPFAGESTTATIENVKNTAPRRPQSLRPTISTNLETICLKCLEKEPARRYTTALELAEDIERFLDGRPVSARSVAPLVRLWMWTRRNPSHAALATTGCLAILISLALVIVWQQGRTSLFEETSFRLAIGGIQVNRLKEHTPGWSHEAWTNALAAARIRTSDEVRDQAVATLAGLDLTAFDKIEAYEAEQAVWNPTGTEVFIVGTNGHQQIWNADANSLRQLPRVGTGPVVFSETGVPCQLDYDETRRAIVLWDCSSNKVAREWQIPTTNELKTPYLNLAKLTPWGKSGVVAFSGEVGVWTIARLEDHSVRVVGRLTTNPAVAVTISADGNTIAAADQQRRIRVWTGSQDPQPIEFPAGRHAVRALALGRGTTRHNTADGLAVTSALLAVGDASGSVNIWELGGPSPPIRCPGGLYVATALAFSPDGMTLASGGKGPIKLWDVTTGRTLFSIPHGGDGRVISSSDFSFDGKRLVSSSIDGNPKPAEVLAWSLEFGRGIQQLRGLDSAISKLCFSSDGRRLAAMSHGWEIGVWDLDGERMLQRIEAPQGASPDNAGLAFSPDGNSLAFAAYEEARIWDVASGNERLRQRLPRGLSEVLSYPTSDELFLFRRERVDENDPNSERICHLRNLLLPGDTKPIEIMPDFSRDLLDVNPVLNGRAFVTVGVSESNGNTTAWIKCFDANTGRRLWEAIPFHDDRIGLVPDPQGELLVFTPGISSISTLVRAASGERVASLGFQPKAMCSEPRLYAELTELPGQGQGVLVHSGDRASPLFFLSREGEPEVVAFDRTGNRLAWGNPNGTITVCNVKVITAQLSRLKSSASSASPPH